ncbi:hypothetical protein VOLCADRAFT_99087 [Volvox carteri f. nagariensis]|uniref:Uncharacterized protein n=1 Tax=Volvox carteri f. nagariensis TaxID=3068 RepID=D8UH04_VOLCA|nr:uncharacterized protein VOLCADRAFT_99087 [Volvox carteri f. nagariensis]EFJ40958.1 hypothetical protein VOLCADRAFT_99087 [Volvox carteri f. nagariensis]|eukprot:XP_002957932.1 hypothetical protein VOLCADRAFT_99087 [Volvox carteri f. nagariensis]
MSGSLRSGRYCHTHDTCIEECMVMTVSGVHPRLGTVIDEENEVCPNLFTETEMQSQSLQVRAARSWSLGLLTFSSQHPNLKRMRNWCNRWGRVVRARWCPHPMVTTRLDPGGPGGEPLGFTQGVRVLTHPTCIKPLHKIPQDASHRQLEGSIMRHQIIHMQTSLRA